MPWTNPIYSRTQADVDRVNQLGSRIEKDGLSSLSPAELSEWMSGTMIGALNAGDLNRIEGNTAYMSEILNGYGYNQAMTCKANWTMTDFEYLREIRRIIYNIQTLLDVYHHPMIGGMCWADLEHLTWADLERMSWADLEPVPIELPDPAGRLDYIKVNNIERILYELKDMVRRMELAFLRCGTFDCGDDYDL